MIHDRLHMAVARSRFKTCPYGIVDPRAIYKQEHVKDSPDTLLTKEEVIELSKKAHIVVLTYIKDRGDPQVAGL